MPIRGPKPLSRFGVAKTSSFAAAQFGAQTYTDPLTEDAEAVATRLYLTILDRDRDN